MAPLGATFLKQRNAQKKTDEPSEGTEKRPRVEPTLGNEHFEIGRASCRERVLAIV